MLQTKDNKGPYKHDLLVAALDSVNELIDSVVINKMDQITYS